MAEIEESLYGYSSSAVVEYWEWVSMPSSIDGRLLKIGALHKAMLIMLSKKKEIVIQGFSGRTEWNKFISRFQILVSYFCDIPEAKEISGIRQETSVLRPCIRCVSEMADFQAIRNKEAWSIQDTLNMRKRFLKLGRAGSSYRVEGFQI